MMNNCGGDEGISAHQSSHIVEPVIAHSPAVVQRGAFMCSQSQQAACGVSLASAVFEFENPEECVLG